MKPDRSFGGAISRCLIIASGVPAFLLFATTLAFSNPFDLSEKQKAIGGYPSNELPMYGGKEKTSAQIAADVTFLRWVLDKGYTLKTGSRGSVKLGWKYHRKGDPATAMKRFNQAWLQDPENGDAFLGFAIVLAGRCDIKKELGLKCDLDEIEKMFQTAISKPGVGIMAFVDYGRFLWTVERYAESLAMSHRALAVDPDAPSARHHISFVHYKLGQYDEACKWGKLAEKHGDESEEGYVEDMCSRGEDEPESSVGG